MILNLLNKDSVKQYSSIIAIDRREVVRKSQDSIRSLNYPQLLGYLVLILIRRAEILPSSKG